MNRKNKTLFAVAERYLFHKNFKTDNPDTKKIAEAMCEIDVAEMWWLTQE